jgi:hypothetical protein
VTAVARVGDGEVVDGAVIGRGILVVVAVVVLVVVSRVPGAAVVPGDPRGTDEVVDVMVLGVSTTRRCVVSGSDAGSSRAEHAATAAAATTVTTPIPIRVIRTSVATEASGVDRCVMAAHVWLAG